MGKTAGLMQVEIERKTFLTVKRGGCGARAERRACATGEVLFKTFGTIQKSSGPAGRRGVDAKLRNPDSASTAGVKESPRGPLSNHDFPHK
jgi:hypothetical protein